MFPAANIGLFISESAFNFFLLMIESALTQFMLGGGGVRVKG